MSIKVRDICKMYGQQAALSHATFEVKQGQVVGFLGANGAGKSTMMKILAGFIPPTSGEALVNDISVTQHPLTTKKMVGYLPEHNPLYLDMYIAEYLSFVAALYDLDKTVVPKNVQKVMDITGLLPEKTKKIGQLSKGYRQRVGLAQALVHNPQVLILDEPTSGLDPNQLTEIRQLIANVGKEKTVMLSTHIMQEVEALCNHIVIVDKGKIVANDTPQNVQKRAMSANFAPIEVELLKPVDVSLWQTNFAERVESLSNNILLVYAKSNEDIRPHIFNFVVQQGWTLLGMKQQESHLEDVFRTLTTHS